MHIPPTRFVRKKGSSKVNISQIFIWLENYSLRRWKLKSPVLRKCWHDTEEHSLKERINGSCLGNEILEAYAFLLSQQQV
jgi:hypothetical protein